MKRAQTDDRKRLLYALVQYAQESGTFNPHFHRSDMMQRLELTEGQFNIVQKQLGDRYCRYVGPHDGEARYEIVVSECLALRDRFEQEKTHEKRHRQLVLLSLLAALAAIVGAVIGAVLLILFQTR